MERKIIIVTMIIFIYLLAGCQQQERINHYPYYEIGIDGVPSSDKVVAIMFVTEQHPSVFQAGPMLYLGDILDIEDSVGYNPFFGLPPSTIKHTPEYKRRPWIDQIIRCFDSAERHDLLYFADYYLVFITQKAGYIIGLANHDRIAHGAYFSSRPLLKSLVEVGLLEKSELEPSKPREGIPPYMLEDESVFKTD